MGLTAWSGAASAAAVHPPRLTVTRWFVSADPST